MKKIISLILVLCAFVLTGCQRAERLTNLSVVQAVGIDVKDGEYTVSIQYLSPHKGSGSNEDTAKCITSLAYGTGNSVDSAVKAAQATMPDDFFFGENKLIVLSREYSQKHDELVRELKNNENIRCDVLLAVSSDSASKVIENGARGARVPSESIVKQLKRNKSAVTVCRLVAQYEAGNELSLPMIEAGEGYLRVIRR